MTKLFLDAGHGGKDSGAIGNGLYEKELTLQITKKIAEKLTNDYENVEIVLSRDSDTFPTLNARTDKANKMNCDAYISIHINSSDNVQANGFETFVYPNVNAKTVSMQNVMHNEIMNQIKADNVRDRGKKQADFHVLRESHMAAILTECLFISNSSDANKLKSDAFKDKLATGHVLGLEKFFGLKKKPTSKRNEAPLNTVAYQVIAGSFVNKENAEQQMEKLKKDGYDSFIQVK